MKKIIIGTMAGLLLFPTMTFAATGITKNGPNFRSAPSTSSSTFGHIPSGTKLTLDPVNQWWYKTTYNGKTGYVSSNYVTITDSITPAPSSKADKIIADGIKYLGVKYLWGADYDRDGTFKFDCSGFITRIYGDNGVNIIRQSAKASTQGTSVSRSALKKGDLVFFDTDGNGSINHLGVYIGDNKFLHASPAGGKGVQISTISGFWSSHYVKAKRVL